MTPVFLFGSLAQPGALKALLGDDCPFHDIARVLDFQIVWQGETASLAQAYNDQALGMLIPNCPKAIVKRIAKRSETNGLERQAILADYQDGTIPALAFSKPVKRFQGMADSEVAGAEFAKADPAPGSSSGLNARGVEDLAYRRSYQRFFALDEHDLRIPKFEGGHLPPVNRAVFVGSDAAIVLPYDPIRDRVLVVEQFRSGPYARGDANPWMMEPIAGRVDGGETPEQAAHREGLEEAGLVFRDLHLAHKGYSSPGCTTEYFHVFVGIADLPNDAAKIGGLAGEAEDIKGHVLNCSEFLSDLGEGKYPVTPLALAGYWLSLNRDKLRP